jgi:GNAT superfamily N-acetyltransferase
VYELEMEVLAETWGFIPESFETWIAQTESEDFDPNLWWVAEHEGEPIGVLLCHVDEMDPELVYLRVVGVRRGWRGRWLAVALYFHSAQEFRARGLQRAWGLVDADNPSGAHLLAGRSGFQEARRFHIYERRLRGPRPVRRVLRRARRVVSGRASR